MRDSVPYTERGTGVHSRLGVSGIAYRKGAHQAVCVLGVPENRGIY
jgi:hypothetical protein